MSKKEFDKLIEGEILTNNKHHNGRTSSVGFCFMKVDDNEPEYAYDFLSGIVSDDVCVVFETRKKLTKSYGIYASPTGGFFDSIVEDEYCTNKYSLEDFKIVKMAIPDRQNYEWKWETDTNKILKKLNKIEKDRIEKEKREVIEEKLQNSYEEEQLIVFEKFVEHIKKEMNIEIKIGDKYYKIPCAVTSMGFEPSRFGGSTMNVVFETWINK